AQPRPRGNSGGAGPRQRAIALAAPETGGDVISMTEDSRPDSTETVQPTTAAGAPDSSGPVTEDQVRLALRKVKDPELNLNIMDLGLVYEVQVDDGAVEIDMSLTSPGCPAGPMIMTDVERAIRALPGVRDVEINLVWTP